MKPSFDKRHDQFTPGTARSTHRSPLSKATRSLALRSSTVATACSLFLGWSAIGQGYESNDITPIGLASGKLTAAATGKQVGGSMVTPYYPHAMRQSENALTAVDLNPAGYYYSMALCADETQVGGWGYGFTGLHALVWTDDISVDLNPSGYSSSYCYGVHHGEQVGYAQNQVYFVTASHAVCWHNTAASCVDLHPATAYPYSRACGVHDGEEVGYVSTIAYGEGESIAYHTGSHAYRWAGTAASGVDLHPAGFDASEATSTSGMQQGGWGYLALGTSHLHALLWSGDAASVVDLHPAAYTESRINFLTATQQVGEGWIGTPGAVGSVRHALAWSGTAASVVDLNQYLPAGYPHAVATGVDASGNIVGYAYQTLSVGVAIPAGAISVVFAPGHAAPGTLSALALDTPNAAPGDIVTGVVSLGGPAPAGGLNIGFACADPTLGTAPAPVLIPEGQSQYAFAMQTGGATLQVPTSVKVFATDGVVSQTAALTLTPVVKAVGLAANAVEGGFATSATVTLSIPAQAGGATFALTSGNPAVATVPASVTVPQGYTSWTFMVNTTPVTTATTVPISAAFGGRTLTADLSISAAPVVALASFSIPEVVGGQTAYGTVTVNNFPRGAAGAVVTLSSGGGGGSVLTLPANVTIPQGATSATFPIATSVVNGIKSVAVTAAYNGGSLSATAVVNPLPTVVISQADYLTDTHMLKVMATTSYANSVLTYGTDPNAAPLGTMQFELGAFKGSMILANAPSVVTVWNSNGGQSTVPVNLKTSTGGGATGGGGGGGTTTAAKLKLVVKTAGKGTVSMSPSASTYAPGTVVTLTATPTGTAGWVGWTGDAISSSRTINVTMTKDTALTATFK